MTKHGPWVDLHAHPGRCFLAGCQDTSPMITQLGRPDVAGAIASAATAGVCGVSTSTVADLAVLRPNANGGLGAGREFKPGEARADHDTQLLGPTKSLTEASADPIVISHSHLAGPGSDHPRLLTEYAQFNDVATLLGTRGFSPDEVDAVRGSHVVSLFSAVCR